MSEVQGSCLCGDVVWEAAGGLDLMSHCHCSRCRKSHGTAFATYVMCGADDFRLLSGAERIARYESSPGFYRAFCGRCGSVVPDPEPFRGIVAVPAGPFDEDPGVRPLVHIFVASKAPWVEIADALPRFDAYPEGFDAPVLADLPRTEPGTGAVRGSCLCGGVAFVVEGEVLRCWNCHCSRCRKAKAAAFASNLFTSADGVRFIRGEDLLASYKVPEARYFTQFFCRTCGSPTPRIDRSRGFGIVPMGSLDDDPGARPQRHIFTGSRAPWYEIPGGLPQDPEFPTG